MQTRPYKDVYIIKGTPPNMSTTQKMTKMRLLIYNNFKAEPKIITRKKHYATVEKYRILNLTNIVHEALSC